MLMHQEVLGMWSAPCFVPEASPKSTRASAQPFSSNKDSSIHKGLHYPPVGSKASFHRCEQLGNISLYKQTFILCLDISMGRDIRQDLPSIHSFFAKEYK